MFMKNIYINVYQCICFHIYVINVQMKKTNVILLTLNYIEKICNDYGFHSFIKHVLTKYEMIMVSIVL